MIHVRAERLHRCTLQFEDESLEHATLFPFFKRGGEVERLLVIDPWEGTAWVLPFEPNLMSVPFFERRVKIRTALGALRQLNEDEADKLSELWHFDPWWLLDEEPFDVQPTTPLLKKTNCVDRFAIDNPGLGFRRDLSKVVWLFGGSPRQRNFIRWKPTLLPRRRSRAKESTSQVGHSSWILDPVWQRR